MSKNRALKNYYDAGFAAGWASVTKGVGDVWYYPVANASWKDIANENKEEIMTDYLFQLNKQDKMDIDVDIADPDTFLGWLKQLHLSSLHDFIADYESDYDDLIEWMTSEGLRRAY
jgi:hypothetical protein